MARDKLAEIAGVRMRGKGLGHSRGMSEITALVDGWNGAAFRAPHQFIVIRLVTILEVFTREWAANIIDAGDPYATRGADLVKGTLKIDFALARALVGKEVSLGELVSHEVPINGVGDIERVFSRLMDTPLFSHLQGVVDRWAVGIEGRQSTPIMPNPDKVRTDLAGLFEQRHIFVHELPEQQDVEGGILDEYILSTSQFVNAADEAFNTLLYGEYPITQVEMNAAAAADAARVNDELIVILGDFDPSGEDLDLRASQAAWEAYRDRQAEYRSGINHPGHGSIAPLLYSSEVEKLTRERVELLKWYRNREEGDM
ncbi:lysozyme inhibitor LprI family protein [Sphingomonas sp. PAMC 26617]|uniref:lysozyme inhibitor LprI family protein n=1 Tax=Sphingomonas sp. PAMC 26617 TaxID=1112216 RepID=UPI0002887C3B|nr:lysozyme inhibitor LprI family protein [Sphingomonas sp. PAMC 26617]